MKKILIFGDIHLGVPRESTTNPGIVRQANSSAGEVFKSLIPRFKEINPDLVVHMGDAIRDTGTKELDEKLLNEATTLIGDLNLPTINLLGNHELWAFSKDEINEVRQDLKHETKFFGLKDMGLFQIMWLDFEVDTNKLAYISEERLNWIKNVVVEDKPLIVFSHYSTVPLDGSGSFYFENKPQEIHFAYFEKIRNAFASLPAKIFINAHTHFVSYKQIEGKYFISNPAFSENIAAEKYQDNNPGVYSILEIDENKFVFSSYSGKFCFAKIEGEI